MQIFLVGLQRISGTWTILTGTETPSSKLPSGFTSVASINSGVLVISVTPGANNCYATVEFWDSTTVAQVS